MSTLARKIREIRKRAGLTQAQFAEALGVSQATASRWENKENPQQPDFNALCAISDFAKIPAWDLIEDDAHRFSKSDRGLEAKVIGAAKAGEWVESPEWEESEHFEVRLPTPKSWPELEVVGFLVQDDSFDEEFPRGSIVFCSRPQKGPHGVPGPGDRVVVSRMKYTGLCEVTIKAVLVDGKGKLWFRAHTTDPELSETFTSDEDHRVEILGFIIASFKLQKPWELEI